MQLSSPTKMTLIFMGIPLFLLTVFWIFDLRVNLTGSMPIGLYQLHAHQSPKRDDWVSVCLPQEVLTLAIQHIHLHRGNCPSGVEPILKQVIGLPEDQIVITGDMIAVNGVMYPAPNVINDKLPKVKRGYWLYGANDPLLSWDSRYFGSVKSESIQGVVKPLLAKIPNELTAEWLSPSDSSMHS